MDALEHHNAFLGELDAQFNGPAFNSNPQRDSEDGTEDLSVEPSATIGGQEDFDFKLFGLGTDTLTVRRGYANTTLCKLLDGITDLSADTSLNELAFTATGTTEYWLKLTSTGGNLDDDSSTKTLVIVDVDPGADTATQTSKPLGTVIADSGTLTTVNSHLKGSYNVDSCGTLHSWNL